MRARDGYGILGYFTAIAAVAVAFGLTWLLAPLGITKLSPLFLAAVVLSAWYGGWGPGLLATVLSTLGAFFLLLPERSLLVEVEDLLRLIIFVAVALLTSALHAATRRAAEASRQARQAAEQARQAAESASAAKTQFVAMVSHELRTPLNPALLACSSLEFRDDLPADAQEDVATIRRSIELESRLIEDLLDLTRISAGKMRLRLGLIDLRDVIQAAVDVLRPDVQAKSLELTLDLADHPLQLHGDPGRLQQVFWNLLRNAVKFTPEHGHITVRATEEDGQLLAEVEDTGIGIPPDRLRKIFTAFEQGSAEITDRFGGLGLGLAICQALVSAHHGQIHAASPGPNQGARFTVSLPALALEPSGTGLPAALTPAT